MNLHGIVSGAIGAVNPPKAAVLKICTGSTTSGPGRRTPTYAADVTVSAQVQDLSQKDLQHLDALNVQGSEKVIYLNGALSGMNRPKGTGPDLVVLGSETWMVTAVLEQWDDWAKVAVTLQNGA
jgi:hypothetical protein